MQKRYSVFAGVLLSAMLVSMTQPAFAQYDVFDKSVLYDWLEDPANKKALAVSTGATGSGTPIFDANGVIGASLISGGVFGAIAGMLFIRGRNGKYAQMGRG